MQQKQSRAFGWLSLLVWPTAAVRLSLQKSTSHCVAIGVLALASCHGLVAAGAVTGGAEPFPDLWDYLVSTMRLAAVLAFMTFIGVGLVAALVVGVVLAVVRRTGRDVHAARLRAASLVPVSFLIPSMAWGLCAMFACIKDPGFSFVHIAKPAWTGSPFFDLFSSGWWLWIGAVAMCVSAIVAAMRVGELVPESGEDCCEKCGYALTGLGEGRCPECGEFHS